MTKVSVKRAYDASKRLKAAEATRARILNVARRRFIARGYVATTVAEIAKTAKVSVDTVYASVGTKQVLFQTLIETAISGAEYEIPAQQRDYVQAIRAAPDARRKLAIYAHALRQIHERLSPLSRVLKDAAGVDKHLAKLWSYLQQRRAANMRLFAADLNADSSLRRDQTLDQIADVIWSTSSTELYLLLTVDRGWSAEYYETWLRDAWTRLLLA